MHVPEAGEVPLFTAIIAPVCATYTWLFGVTTPRIASLAPPPAGKFTVVEMSKPVPGGPLPGATEAEQVVPHVSASAEIGRKAKVDIKTKIATKKATIILVERFLLTTWVQLILRRAIHLYLGVLKVK